MTKLKDGLFFNVKDFACQCGCGRVEISPELIPILDRVRVLVNFPMIVTSGFRCQKHNANVGGGPEHTRGQAADILVADEKGAFRIVEAAILAGVQRIGIDTTPRAIMNHRAFVHIGISESLARPVIWTY